MAVLEAPFEVPTPRDIRKARLSDGERIVIRRHGNSRGPRMLLSHGNGFATDMYYPVWGQFLDEFEVVVFDLRNHGWNGVGAAERHNVPQLAKDGDQVAREVTRCFGPKPTLGVFHSVSALAACLSPSLGQDFEGLFLLDPPICKPGVTYQRLDAAATREASRARRRQVRYESPEQFVWMLEVLTRGYRQPVAGSWELMARSVLRRDEEGGGWVVRCPRHYEAHIAEYLSTLGVLVDLQRLRCPVRVLGADPTLPFSFIPSFNLRVLVACDYDFIPEASHMLFIEEPAACAARIRAFAVECGLVLP